VSDEGFREIQLNGKQLVFLFMAATVVLVVCFLFGVLVGRGVRENVGAGTEVADVRPDPQAAAASETPAPLGATPPVTPPATAEAAPQAEELSYAERLLREEVPTEKLRETPPKAAAAPPAPATAAVQEPGCSGDAPPAAPAARAPAASLSTASDPPARALQVRLRLIGIVGKLRPWPSS
jgi:hypothetical protein